MSFNPKKTEIVYFTNKNLPENIEFHLDNQNIPIVHSHKHLRIMLSGDCKWNEQICNISKNISKHLSVLRKLKYKLNRLNLEKLYLTFIRPLFEYGCEIWDNCGINNSENLEKLQREAARIVTGLPYYCKIESIYLETGWEQLSERRKRRRLQLFYNITNGNAPQYLQNLIPPSVATLSRYDLRNNTDLIVPFCRLERTRTSFFPETIRCWNELN